MAKDEKGKRPRKRGYGLPPEEHRWKKGCPSPNPGGRPKGAGSTAAKFRRICAEVVGKDKHGNPMDIEEAILRRTALEAGQGKQAMIKIALQLLGAFDPPPPPEEEVEVYEVWMNFENEKPLQPVVLTSNDAWAHLAIRGPNDPASDPPLSTDE